MKIASATGKNAFAQWRRLMPTSVPSLVGARFDAPMPMQRLCTLLAVALLAIAACASSAAEAAECQWFGTAPLCDGSCPAGWEIKEFSAKGCVGTWGVSGTKVLCCKLPVKCQFGTPGCPYPPF